jgi:hypothetical protein
MNNFNLSETVGCNSGAHRGCKGRYFGPGESGTDKGRDPARYHFLMRLGQYITIYRFVLRDEVAIDQGYPG